MGEAEHFLGLIKPIPKKPARKPPKIGISAQVELHTHDFIKQEAEARNMTIAEFVREIFEKLESGDF